MSNTPFYAPSLLLSMVISLFLTANSSKIYANVDDSQQPLLSIVHAFVTQHVEHHDDERIIININALSPTAASLHCESDIQASFANGSNAAQFNAVALQCHSEPSWTIYVPVSVQIMSNVVSASHLISPGDIITEHDLAYVESDKNRLYDGFFKDKKDLIGLSVVRTISEGTVLSKRVVRPVAIIKRNQTVTLILKKGAIEIDMLGIAKSDGYLNEVVKIWNPSSKKLIDAVAIGPDRAQLIC